MNEITDILSGFFKKETGSAPEVDWLDDSFTKAIVRTGDEENYFVKFFGDYPLIDLLFSFENHLRKNHFRIPGPYIAIPGLKDYYFRKLVIGSSFDYSQKQLDNLYHAEMKFREINKTFSERKEVYGSACSVGAELEKIRCEIVKILSDGHFKSDWNSGMMKWLSSNSSFFLENFEIAGAELVDKNGFCCHGDLNIGNVIFVNDEPVFIDLEEFYKNYTASFYDLTYVYFRFFKEGLKFNGNLIWKKEFVSEEILKKTYLIILKRLILTVFYNARFRERTKGNFVDELEKFKNKFISLKREIT